MANKSNGKDAKKAPAKDWREGLSQGQIERREAAERDDAKGGPGR
jgi:hypothetical protein